MQTQLCSWHLRMLDGPVSYRSRSMVVTLLNEKDPHRPLVVARAALAEIAIDIDL